jgi:hypothetical protein
MGGSGSDGQQALHGISQTTTRDQPRPAILAADGVESGPICGRSPCDNERSFMLQWMALLQFEVWIVSRSAHRFNGSVDMTGCFAEACTSALGRKGQQEDSHRVPAKRRKRPV